MPTPSETDLGAGYFRVKSRLLQLVKRTTTRVYQDSSTEELPSIDGTFACHAEVKEFLASIAPAYQLEGHADVMQRYELNVTAHCLVLQIYLPFMCASHAGTSSRAHATLEAVQAAHNIVAASRVLQSSGDKIAMEGFMHGQALFSAVVVCAHAVIGDGSAIWASEGLADIQYSLKILSDAGEIESVKVVEALLAKAEASVAGTRTAAGGKRKREEMEDEGLDMPVGFCLPYAGPGVAVSSDVAYDESDARESSVDSQRSCSPEADRLVNADKSKAKDKKLKHPPHGVRKRLAEEGPPYLREKLEIPQTARTSSDQLPNVELRLPTPSPANSYSYPTSSQDGTPAYEQPLSTDLVPPQIQEYQTSFDSHETGLQFSADHHLGYSSALVDSNQISFQGSASSPLVYNNEFSGKSPTVTAFPHVSYEPTPAADQFSAQPYPQQEFRTNHHIPMGMSSDGTAGVTLHAHYKESKQYITDPQFQPHEPIRNQNWEQSRTGSSVPQQIQFWPQNGFYHS